MKNKVMYGSPGPFFDSSSSGDVVVQQKGDYGENIFFVTLFYNGRPYDECSWF